MLYDQIFINQMYFISHVYTPLLNGGVLHKNTIFRIVFFLNCQIEKDFNILLFLQIILSFSPVKFGCHLCVTQLCYLNLRQ